MTQVINPPRHGSTRGGAGPHETPRSTGRPRRRWAIQPYLLLLPAAVLLASLMIVPIGIVITYSFQQASVTTQGAPFAGIDNYVAVLTDPDFTGAIGNTLFFVIVSVAVHLVLGLLFASLLNSTLIPRAALAVFRTIFLLPWVFTVAVVAVLWRLLLDPNGVINFLLSLVGGEKTAWLSDPHLALIAVTFINIWAGYPFFMVSMLGGMQSIPGDLYEAARVDGAGVIRRFWSITLPQLRPVIISMSLLDLIWTSQQFALIWMTTGGGPLHATEMLSTYTYKQAFSEYEFSTASAAAVIVLLLTMVLAFFYVRQQRER
jgi:multiple sugar transport system permease protein